MTTRARAAGEDVAQEASDEAREVAYSAAERGGALAGKAKREAREVVGTAKSRAGDVTDELSARGRSMLDETTSQLEHQAQEVAGRAASSLQRLGGEAQALAEGRPEDAPVLADYAWKLADASYGAADRIHDLAEDMETRGFSGVLDDLSTYARRRPGAFLLGAALVGFGVGRMVKAEAARRQSEEPDVTPRAITTRASAGR
jgi:hypothetical protein